MKYLITLSLLALSACVLPTPTPSPSPSGVPSASPSPSPSISPSVIPSPSASPSVSPTPTPSPTPLPSKTPSPSPTPSPTASVLVLAISPQSGNINIAGTIQFTANLPVVWSLSYDLGSISSAGLYTSPATHTGFNTVYAVATAGLQTAQAQINLGPFGGASPSPSPSASVSPSPSVSPKPSVTPSPSPVITPPTWAGSTALAGTKMGVNITSPNDWNNDRMFADSIKTARAFDQPGHGSEFRGSTWNAPADANGWPTTDFDFVVDTTQKQSTVGTWQLSFTGQATVTPGVSGPDVVNKLTYNAATNTTSGTVTVVSPTNYGLNFRNTKYLPTDTAGTGVKNIQLFRAGSTPSDVFFKPFLTAIAPFSTLRFMDAEFANNNKTTLWSQRTKVTDALQNGSTGISYEYLVQLANLSGKDIWINLPFMVDYSDATTSNYAFQLATLLKSSLNSNIHVYLEYGNEMWNFSFTQAQWEVDQVLADIAAGDTRYTTTNKWDAAEQRVANEVALISKQFAKVYGQAAIGTTIRPVLAGQAAGANVNMLQLTWMAANYGPPANYIYGTSGAPYYQAVSATYTTEPSIIAALTTALPLIFPWMNQGILTNVDYAVHGGYPPGVTNQGLADYYHVKYTGYESGPDVSLVTTQAEAGLVLTDSAMATLNQNFYNEWFGCGNDLVNYYALTDNGYYFGMYEDITVPTIKSAAVGAVAATTLGSYTTCK